MSILRISVLFRSPSVSWDYKAATNRILADDVVAQIEKMTFLTKPVRISKSSVQHLFYIVTDCDAEHHRDEVGKMLDKLIEKPDIRKCVYVSVTEPGIDELNEVRKSAPAQENSAFLEIVDKEYPPSKQDKPLSEPVKKADDVSKLIEKGEKAQAEGTEEPKEQKESKEQATLSDVTKKLQTLRNTLLSKVRGQRHAVDTVVQGVFESEMFSAQNTDRNGPLATFLFAGPSGVGKTFLARLMEKTLDRQLLVVDMSEYSDNLANGKFNGEHGRPAVVTGFARKNPDGIIVFDEIEKAHINAIHQFLQILDGARMMDHQIKKEVSFKNNIIIMTTNAGHALYEDSTACDLSSVPRSVILDGLRKDINPQTSEPYFPECITTRMANGRVILFNHLEPYALLQIVKDEIALQMSLFEKSSGIKVNYDPIMLSALVLFNGGGVSDARTLRGLARSIVTRELQEVIMQLLDIGFERVDSLKEITLTICTEENEEISKMFSRRERMQVLVLTDENTERFNNNIKDLMTDFTVVSNEDDFKRCVRGVTDYILLDPLCGNQEKDMVPNDVEDLYSVGMRMFEYVREYFPEIPVYILDTSGKVRSFDTLLAKGAKGLVPAYETCGIEFEKALEELSFCALVNNNTFSLGRSNKFMSFNCAQYLIDDSCAIISFEKLSLKSAPMAGDRQIIAKKGENSNLTFSDVIGCKAAKEALMDYRDMMEDPRKIAMKGKKMPKGVLLYGPPGTGKTMLAKAMANECSATFFPVSAASFFGPLVGQTEQNIRELFTKARKYAPSIIFVDEVDAIARVRTGAIGSTHNEDALTVFLAEMDGFVVDEKRPVFVLAATNYDIDGETARVLDPAFVRRFDRKILIDLPDTDDRYALLEKSLKNHGIHFGENHEKILKNMAKRTGGMNNADLEMINSNYARVLGDKKPDGASYMEAFDAYRFGDVNKMDPEHLRQTACHEAGHALVCRLCGVTPSFLTVVSRGSFGGYMESASEKENGTYTYRELMDRVCRCLAGRVAEIEVYGDTAGTNTGASADIKQARYFMKLCLNEYAMGDKLYARWTQDEIEQQMKKEYNRTCEMIRDNRAVLDALTDKLVQHKSMDQTQLEDFFTSMNI